MLNQCKNLLQPKSVLNVPKIVLKTMAQDLAADFEARIENLEDYKALLSAKVEVETRVDDKILKKNFNKIDAAARQKIWDLLFDAGNTLDGKQQAEIGNFIKNVKENAAFYSPWQYNEWIVKVRDELLKREMCEFWQEQIVKLKLGPCSWRDSDYFDKGEEDPTVNFYENANSEKTDDKPSAAAASGEVNVSTLEDYRKMIEIHEKNEELDDDEREEDFEKISACTRNKIWKLLFEEQPSTTENLKIAAELLEAHRPDAAFHAPWVYNEWIVTLREELLERKMLEFWRDVIVKKELGLIWARDSDYYDDMDDPEPELFYKRAGCKAPFSEE